MGGEVSAAGEEQRPFDDFCEMSATGELRPSRGSTRSANGGHKPQTASPTSMLPASARSVGLHHHFISPLLTLAPISSATIRPAVG